MAGGDDVDGGPSTKSFRQRQVARQHVSEGSRASIRAVTVATPSRPWSCLLPRLILRCASPADYPPTTVSLAVERPLDITVCPLCATCGVGQLAQLLLHPRIELAAARAKWGFKVNIAIDSRQWA